MFCAARGLASANSQYASIQGFTQGIEVTTSPTFPTAVSTQGIDIAASPITQNGVAIISPALRSVASPKPIFPVEKSSYVFQNSRPRLAAVCLTLSNGVFLLKKSGCSARVVCSISIA